jgi:signal transduction histidine kinase
MSRARLPMFGVAVLLLGLIALLATLQYRWLGQVSEAERERMQSTLRTGASEFAQDFDRELTRAYLLFQLEPAIEGDAAARVAARHDQWHASSKFPRLIKDYLVYTDGSPDGARVDRFDPATRTLHRIETPDWVTRRRPQLETKDVTSGEGGRAVFIARAAHPIWEDVPAIVAPAALPLMILSGLHGEPRNPHALSFTILTLDLDYVRQEILPSLAERHFGRDGRLDFDVAVVKAEGAGDIVYSSSAAFAPKADVKADADAPMFQVRTQDFGNIVAEVRRFSTIASLGATHGATASGSFRIVEGTAVPPPRDVTTLRNARPWSVWVQTTPQQERNATSGSTTAARLTMVPNAGWRLVLRHPSGSLETAVSSLRRRNLVVSSSILGVLAASMALLVISTRRAQRLARQQMEFVATVSHELRTPLAVIRSASENLADGVVRDDEQIKRYGELLRNEGRRLTEMVEQILEFAGIQSGQRGFALRSVAVGPLLQELAASSSSLADEASVAIELTIPEDLPPVLGDEPALRRVFQNLLGNAIKYGAQGQWVGVSARKMGNHVRVTVADRGMGIPPAEQARIFEPFYRATDAISAQIQGAGLGLSLVQRIVEAHGGQVTVKSAPGQGSEFMVQLPAAGEEPAGDRVDVPATSGSQSLADAHASRSN